MSPNGVRSIAATIIGALVIAVLLPGMPAFELLPQLAFLRTPLVIIVGLFIGLSGTQRPLLVGACAYVLGVALWTVLTLRPSPPWLPSDNWSIGAWGAFVAGTVITGAVLMAMVAYVGNRIRRLAGSR